jgi:hypothetical protein
MPDLFGAPVYDGLTRSAGLSPCGRYRYWLRRAWLHGGDGRTACFVMLNPSTADAGADDPTVRRCLAFVRAWGCSALEVRNLFALRATDPGALLSAADPVGPEGDAQLALARDAAPVVAAWGAGVPFGRDRAALVLLAGTPLYCLGTTKGGQPRHPLYVRGDARLVPWPEGGAADA